MRFESGPLSTTLNDPAVVEAADPFVRILVRVPEAYLLVRAFGASRPGLLLLDADARFVGDYALLAKGGAPALASWLKETRAKTATEIHLLALEGEGDRAAFGKAVRALPGVKSAADASPAPLFRIEMEAGCLPPEAVRVLANRFALKTIYHQPLPLPSAKKEAPGVWYRAGGVWVTTLLAQPQTCEGLEARVFLLPGVSLGARGFGVAAAPLDIDGVVSVFPDLWRGEQTVVARKGTEPWEKVLQAFAKAGCEARAKP